MALWSGAALAVCIVIGLSAWTLNPTAPKPVTRFAMSLPPGQLLAWTAARTAIAISPDGTYLVYAARAPGSIALTRTQLYLRAMDGLESRPIAGTEGAMSPFFSPDGQWIGFWAGRELKKVSLNGGAPISLGAVSPDPRVGGFAASWSSRGMVAFTPEEYHPLQQISD